MNSYQASDITHSDRIYITTVLIHTDFKSIAVFGRLENTKSVTVVLKTHGFLI